MLEFVSRFQHSQRECFPFMMDLLPLLTFSSSQILPGQLRRLFAVQLGYDWTKLVSRFIGPQDQPVVWVGGVVDDRGNADVSLVADDVSR